MERKYILGDHVFFDILKREIITENEVIPLGGREAAILKLLCERGNQVITKEDIHEVVWGKVLVSETSLTKAISNLRKSMDTIEGLKCEIKTVPKEGYMMILEDETIGTLAVDPPPQLIVKGVNKDVDMNAAKDRFKVIPSNGKRSDEVIEGSFLSKLVSVFSSALLASIITALLFSLLIYE